MLQTSWKIQRLTVSASHVFCCSGRLALEQTGAILGLVEDLDNEGEILFVSSAIIESMMLWLDSWTRAPSLGQRLCSSFGGTRPCLRSQVHAQGLSQSGSRAKTFV